LRAVPIDSQRSFDRARAGEFAKRVRGAS
jgi:hypothetical protein